MSLETLLATLAGVGESGLSHGLPAELYTSPELFERELDRVFGHGWLIVGRADELPEPGDRLAIDIAGEPVIVARGDDGRLRAMSGVCRHRYFPVCEEGFSTGPRLTCGYHRWSYRLDGRCHAAPLMDEVDGFDISEVALPELTLAEWEGFVLVSLDPDAAPLGDRFAPISAELGRHRLAEQRQISRYDERWFGNWKAAVENGSESYHHLGPHRKSVQPYMPAQSAQPQTGTEHYTWHRTEISELAERHGRIDPALGLAEADLSHARFFTLFPSSVIAVVGPSVDWLTFLPISPSETRVIGGSVYPTWTLDEAGLESLLAAQQEMADVVNREDAASIARLQRGVRSRLAKPGWLNPREEGVREFWRYLARELV